MCHFICHSIVWKEFDNYVFFSWYTALRYIGQYKKTISKIRNVRLNSYSRFTPNQYTTTILQYTSKLLMSHLPTAFILITCSFSGGYKNGINRLKWVKPLRANPIKWSNTMKQFVSFCQRNVWVCLTILWGWCLKD